MKNPFFDRAPQTIIFWENFKTFFLGYELLFDDQTLMVFRYNWKVDSSVKKTSSKNPGTLNCLQKSSRLISCCWEIFGTIFGIFFDIPDLKSVRWYVREDTECLWDFSKQFLTSAAEKRGFLKAILRNCLFLGCRKFLRATSSFSYFQAFSIANSSNFSIYGS